MTPLGWREERLRFEAMLAPTSPREFIAFCIVMVLLGQLPSLLGNLLGTRLANAVSIAGVVLLVLIWWFYDRRRARKHARTIAFQPCKQTPPAATGLILLLSPYDPRSADLKDPSTLRRLLDKIMTHPPEDLGEQDFAAINLFESNLRPQIKAVEFHSGSLRDVWLIASQTTANTRGSEDAAQLLEKYLRFKYPAQFKVHREGLSAPEWDYKCLWEIAEKVFRRSPYKEEVIVADVTGGTKMMSVALAMACIPPGRRMEYVYSERDSQGNPLPGGAIEPVVIDIDPILYGSRVEPLPAIDS